MNLWEVFGLGLALAVDVFGISFAYGLITKRHRTLIMLRLAGICGAMQMLMPVIGYLGTAAISAWISRFDYLLVFFVFSALGINVLREAAEDEEECIKKKKLTWKVAFALGIATSIDALVSGTMIYLTQTPLFSTALIIGLCSFIIGIVGFNLNIFMKKLPEKYLQILAGLILIGLGLKSLIMHFL